MITSFVRADGAISGTSIFGVGLTATTVSATTYQNLPDNVSGYYLPLSGGTVTGETLFTSGVSISGSVVTSGSQVYHITDDFIVENPTINGSLLEARISGGVNIWSLNSNISIDAENRILYDSVAGGWSIDWENRQLIKSDGTTVSFDWENGILTGQTNIQSSTISATTYYNLPIKVSVDFGFDATYATTSSTFAQIPLNVVVQSASTYNSTYTGMTATLICDISESDTGITGEFELYDVTNLSSIVGSTTSFVDTDGLKSSSSFTITSSDFDDTFRVRIRRTSGTGTDNVRIRSAQLLLTLV